MKTALFELALAFPIGVVLLALLPADASLLETSCAGAVSVMASGHWLRAFLKD